MRSFKVIGDDLLFDGQTIATMNPRLSASLRDELEQFFDGMTLDVMPFDEADKLAAEARAEAHAEGLSEGFDAGYRDGYEVGRRNGAA
jgi:flagellar biosynthesis/type III secretory pathway protein FliH